MNIYPVQKSIVDHLQEDFSNAGAAFTAKDLPEVSKDFDVALESPIAYVVYTGSQTSPSVTSNTIAQPRKLKFSCEVHARKLYGPNGLFIVRDILEQSLVGFKPVQCQRLSLVDDQITQDKDNAFWIHIFQFEAETMLVQKDETDPIIVPQFKEVIAKED